MGDYLDPPKANTSVPGEWPPIRLRQLLMYLLYSHRQLADALGIKNRRAISNWINQGEKPYVSSRRLLDRLAEERGFFLAEKRVKHLPYAKFGETTNRYRIKRTRQERGTYADLPIGETDGG